MCWATGHISLLSQMRVATHIVFKLGSPRSPLSFFGFSAMAAAGPAAVAIAARDAEAAILALAGRVDDSGPPSEIERLLAERKALQEQKATVKKQLKAERRRKKKILEKTRTLSDSELMAEFVARAKARAKAKAHA